MNGTKGLLLSTSIWGSIVAMIPALADGLDKLLGTGLLPPHVAAIVAGAGALVAFLGRVTATKKIAGLI